MAPDPTEELQRLQRERDLYRALLRLGTEPDLDRFGESKMLKGNLTPIDIVYEPTHKELYVATREP